MSARRFPMSRLLGALVLHLAEDAEGGDADLDARGGPPADQVRDVVRLGDGPPAALHVEAGDAVPADAAAGVDAQDAEDHRRAEQQARLDRDDGEVVRDERSGGADEREVVEVVRVAAAQQERHARDEVEVELRAVDEAFVERLGVHLSGVGADARGACLDGDEEGEEEDCAFHGSGWAAGCAGDAAQSTTRRRAFASAPSARAVCASLLPGKRVDSPPSQRTARRRAPGDPAT